MHAIGGPWHIALAKAGVESVPILVVRTKEAIESGRLFDNGYSVEIRTRVRLLNKMVTPLLRGRGFVCLPACLPLRVGAPF
jgi:hypothetical protein